MAGTKNIPAMGFFIVNEFNKCVYYAKNFSSVRNSIPHISKMTLTMDR